MALFRIVMLVFVSWSTLQCSGCHSETAVSVLSSDSTFSENTKAPPLVETGVLDVVPIREIKVSSFFELQRAVKLAKPGDAIFLKDGIYVGNLKIFKSGSKKNPIQLIGSNKVILKGKSLESGYAVHLKASYWHLKNFQIKRSKKGLVLDRASFNVLSSLKISKIGEEAIHFRSLSSNNILQDSKVSDVGLVNPGFGEAVYIGSPKKHWCKHSDCKPDKSNNNKIIRNHFSNISAEAVDIKEGTEGSLIYKNIFDSRGLSGENYADSVMDIKGNRSIIRENRVIGSKKSAIKDGFQVHRRVKGWGNGTVFSGNEFKGSMPGYGIEVDSKARATVIKCNNRAYRARLGLANKRCTK